MTSRLVEFEQRRALDAKRQAVRKRRSVIPQAVLEAKVIGKPCRVCAATIGGEWQRQPEAHHLIPRGIMRGAELNTAENIIPLCHQHHQDHHTTVHGRVPRSLLHRDESEFLRQHRSSGWVDKWYPEGGVLCLV